MAVWPDTIVYGGKVAVVVVVAGAYVVDGVGTRLAAQVAHAVVAGKDARHDVRGPATR